MPFAFRSGKKSVGIRVTQKKRGILRDATQAGYEGSYVEEEVVLGVIGDSCSLMCKLILGKHEILSL